MKKLTVLILFSLLLVSCGSQNIFPRADKPASIAAPASAAIATQVAAATSVPPANSTVPAQLSVVDSVPSFDHIVLIMLENEYYQNVIGSDEMPHLNDLALRNVLLSNYFAVAHPSLPNYLALVSGSTQAITTDCTDCFVNQPNLADELEASGRKWKSYQESMPSACFIGNARPYAQMTNPFVYFDSIRLNASRCEQSIVPLDQLDSDLAANDLPDFALIMPNLCNSGHDCSLDTADNWMNEMVAKLQASPALGKNSLIVITFDEGARRDPAKPAGTGPKSRGQIPAVLISPSAVPGLNDATVYSHYSLLKTILAAWDLPALGHTADPTIPLILTPWSKPAGQ
jgi:phosphatidylinositol-3-phosphatase